MDMEHEFYVELTSEKLTRDETATGYSKWVWVKDSTVPNDFGDAVKLLLVLWHFVGAAFAPSSEAKEAITAAPEPANGSS